MAEIVTMGEIIVEIMRDGVDVPLNKAGVFRGPYPSGAPAIFIDTAARLGHSAKIIGGVGNDDFGKCLLDRLTKDGVDCSDVRIDDNVSTGCAFVTYFADGGRKFIFHIGNTPAVTAPVPDKAKLEGTKFFHIMGCSMMADIAFGKRIVETMRLAKESGAKVSFDPNIRPELMKDPEAGKLVDEVMAVVNVFLPGIDELLNISGAADIESAVKKLFENENLEIIALKRGSKGCTVYTRDGGEFSFGVYPIKPVDATGAGDSFDASFLCGLLDGLDIPGAVKLATAAASLNTAAFGPMEGDISPKTTKDMICAYPDVK